MPVVINTNTAASIASNNLSASNAMLQRSLNRLSSGSKITNASDDAGGVAVAARLSSAAKRSSIANANIGNAVSFLQNQDSALKTLSKVLERMSELQTLNADVTKSVQDRSNYSLEFASLTTQVEKIKDLTFNGLSLLDSQSGIVVNVGDQVADKFTTADMSTAVAGVSNLNLGNVLDPDHITGEAATTFVGAATTGGATNGNLVINGVTVDLDAGDDMNEIVAKINASSTGVTASITGVASAGTLTLTSNFFGPEGIELAGSDAAIMTALQLDGGTENFGVYGTVNSTGVTAGIGTLGETYRGGGGETARVNLQNAIQSVAGARARNGSDQSTLGFYSELNAANKANYESAISKIMDVDVAEESTQLARWNTLVQAGTAMVAQANGQGQNVLTLLR